MIRMKLHWPEHEFSMHRLRLEEINRSEHARSRTEVLSGETRMTLSTWPTTVCDDSARPLYGDGHLDLLGKE
jgi:hypothetical protein